MSRNQRRIFSLTVIMICSVLGFSACDRHDWKSTAKLYEEHGGHGDGHDTHDSHSDGAHVEGTEAHGGEAHGDKAHAEDAHGKEEAHAPAKDDKHAEKDH